MKKIVLCAKTNKSNEYAFIYRETEDYVLRTEVRAALTREKYFDKNHDNLYLCVESDIAPIIIELMYDCLEDEKSFKVII